MLQLKLWSWSMRKGYRATPQTASPLGFQHPAIEQLPLQQLKPAEQRLRTHNRAQKRKLAAILRTVGFIDPIVADDNGNVLAGHMRLEVAQELGLKTVPVIRISHLNDLEKRTYALAANRLAE